MLKFMSVVIAFVVLVISYFKWIYQYWHRKNLPYLEPKFLFGNLAENVKGKEHIATTMKRLYDEMKSQGWKHGGVFLFTSPNYFLTDLDYVKNILTKDFQYFHDRSNYYNEEDDPLSAHLGSVTGVKWRNLRMKLTPTFTSGKMKMMFQSFVQCERNLEKKMEVKYKKKQPLDVKKIFELFTTDVIGSVAFGLDCNGFEDDDSPFRINGKRVIQITTFERIKRLFAILYPDICRKLHVRIVPKDVAEFYMKIVNDTVNYRETSGITRNDFMQLLINLKNNELIGDDGQKIEGSKMTMNEVAAQSFLFFVAGFETSATLMTWTLYELAKNINIQEKLRLEVKSILSKHGGITYESLQDMKYLSQVIDESLRKYPPAGLTNRTCVKDYKLPDDDIVIEKGTTVIIPIYGIHHDEQYYPNPEKFDPERFSEENKKSRHHYSHLPFGEGPRICIGMRFALMQAKVGLISLLKNYKFTVNKKTKEPIQFQVNSVILSAKGGIWLDAEKIQD